MIVLLVLEERVLVINVNMQRCLAVSDGASHNQPSPGFVCYASVISHAGHQTAKKRLRPRSKRENKANVFETELIVNCCFI